MLSDPNIEMTLVAIVTMYPNEWHNFSFLKPDDFTDALSSRVWEEIGKFIVEGRKPDPRLLSKSIYSNEVDQQKSCAMLSDWAANIVTPYGADDYARIIKDLSDRRKIVATANETLKLAEDTACGYNASEIASLCISNVANSQNDCNDFVPLHEVCDKIIENLDKKTPCFSTGFKRLDEALGGGFYRNRFYGIGARMKAGKSMLMSTIAYNMALAKNARVLYLCLEMGQEESAQRIMSMHMCVNPLKFMNDSVKSTDWFKDRAKEARKHLDNCGVYFRSRPRMTLDDLKATLARAGMSGKVDGVIVDYLQLVEGKTKNQSQAEHLDNVSQTLAEAVKRFPIWVLSAAQLNREGAVRGSDGLLMACDLAFSLTKLEGSTKSWLETIVSRYTPYTDIGSEFNPGYDLEVNNGLKFVELK